MTKKRKKAVRLTKGFIGRVSDEIKNIKLPPYPWSLRFDKALFDRMKNEFPGERTRLRVALKRYCRWHCRRKAYLQALASGNMRRNLEWELTPVKKEHRIFAQRMLVKMTAPRRRDAKKGDVPVTYRTRSRRRGPSNHQPASR